MLESLEALRLSLASFVLASGLSAVSPEPDAPEYAYRLSLQAPTAAPSQLLELPDSVYAGAHYADLADVYVEDADGRQVPHAICPPAPPPSRPEQRRPLPLYRLQAPARQGAAAGTAVITQRSDGSLVSSTLTLLPASIGNDPGPAGDYLLDLGAMDAPVTALQLDWQRQDDGSELELELAGSPDLQSWTALGPARLLQVEGEGPRLAASRIALTAPVRYLRLGSPVPLSRLQVQALLPEPSQAPALRWFSATAGQSVTRDGRVVIDYQSRPAAPVQSARIHWPADFSAVEIRLGAVDTGNEPYLPLWQGVLHPADSAPDAPLIWPAQASRRLRMEFLRGGQAVTQPPGLELGYQPSRLAFAPQGRGPWQLVYGRSQLPGLERWQCQELLIGEPAIATAAGEPKQFLVPTKPAEARHWQLPRNWGLWSLLLLGAAGVVGMAWQTLRERR